MRIAPEIDLGREWFMGGRVEGHPPFDFELALILMLDMHLDIDHVLHLDIDDVLDVDDDVVSSGVLPDEPHRVVAAVSDEAIGEEQRRQLHCTHHHAPP